MGEHKYFPSHNPIGKNSHEVRSGDLKKGKGRIMATVEHHQNHGISPLSPVGNFRHRSAI